MSNPGESHSPEKKRRRFGWLILLLLLLLGGAIYLSAQGGFDWRTQFAAIKTWFSGAQKVEAPAERAVVLPTFDVVRAEPTGELIAAGRAEPGWTVTLESGDLVIGKAVADKNGEWVLQPEKPLPEGEHSLSLQATDEKGERSVMGSQRVAMSIAGRTKPLVALSDEGKPTQIIQKPEESPPAAAKPEEERTVAATGEAKPSQPLNEGNDQPPASDAAVKPDKAEPVLFDAIDYELSSKGGTIFINGRAAPNAKVQIYVNNAFAGETRAGTDGAWSFSAPYDLPRGSHAIRGDHVDAATGRVLARAEVSFEQTEAEEKAPPVTMAEEKSPPTAAAEEKAPPVTVAEEKAPPTAAAEEKAPPITLSEETSRTRQETASVDPRDDRATRPSEPDRNGRPETSSAASPSLKDNVVAARPERTREARGEAAPAPKRTAPKSKSAGHSACRSVTVRRGDTLWHIAERCYGSGYRYTKIFRSNKDQIRDPDLIYPNQRFVIPR